MRSILLKSAPVARMGSLECPSPALWRELVANLKALGRVTCREMAGLLPVEATLPALLVLPTLLPLLCASSEASPALALEAAVLVAANLSPTALAWPDICCCCCLMALARLRTSGVHALVMASRQRRSAGEVFDPPAAPGVAWGLETPPDESSLLEGTRRGGSAVLGELVAEAGPRNEVLTKFLLDCREF